MDVSWKVPLLSHLYNVSREAASHLSNEAGASRNTFIDTSDSESQINVFSNVKSESEDDDDDDDDDEDQSCSRRSRLR